MTHESVDIAIVGGGLVGATLAVALGRAGRRVALVEAAPPPAGERAWDERTIAINVASHRILSGLGLWDGMRHDAAPILSTHISERGHFGVARFSAEEAGEPALGWNLPVRAIGASAWSAMQASTSVDLHCPARVKSVELNSGHATLTLEGANARSKVQARLVVAADGAQSAVRTLLGLGARTRDYRQVAIVGAVRPERPHRDVAYERFTPDGPVALLPKPDNRCGLVWTIPSDEAEPVLGWEDEDFLDHLQQAFGHRLGRFLETGRRSAFPLQRVVADAITAPRVLFAGNAAQTLHPVAAQGFNLGLRDVATVAEIVDGADDPGAPDLLAAYAQRREADRGRTAGFTDVLVRLFSNSVPGLADARHLGLLALDLLPGIKQEVMRQNLGLGSSVPALARSRKSMVSDTIE